MILSRTPRSYVLLVLVFSVYWCDSVSARNHLSDFLLDSGQHLMIQGRRRPSFGSFLSGEAHCLWKSINSPVEKTQIPRCDGPHIHPAALRKAKILPPSPRFVNYIGIVLLERSRS